MPSAADAKAPTLKSALPRASRMPVSKWVAGVHCEAVRVEDLGWYEARVVRAGTAPNTWCVAFADNGALQDNTGADMLREPSRLTGAAGPVRTVAAAAQSRVSRRSVNLAGASVTAALAQWAALEAEELAVRRQLDETAERYDELEAAVRVREHKVQGELARAQAELATVSTSAPEVVQLEEQVRLLRAELEALVEAEEELRNDEEALEAKKREREREKKKREDEQKRKERERERARKERERERQREEEKRLRERERARAAAAKGPKADAKSNKRAEELRAAIEAEEARERAAEEARRREEEEEEERREEEERALFASQQSALAAEEERRKRREREAQRAAATRDEMLKDAQSRRLIQSDLDSLREDEAELDTLLRAATATAGNTPSASASTTASTAAAAAPARARTALPSLEDEDEDDPVAAFLARRAEGSDKKAAPAGSADKAADAPKPASSPVSDKKPPTSPSLNKSASRLDAVRNKLPVRSSVRPPPPGAASAASVAPLAPLELPAGHSLDAAGVALFGRLADVVQKWIDCTNLVADGPALYNIIKELRDPLKELHTANPKDLGAAIAAWRRLNQEMPAKINAARAAK